MGPPTRVGSPARLGLAVAIGLFTVSTVACGNASSSVDAGTSQPVTFKTSDGVMLAGRLFGPPGAQEGVVLSHMLPADQTSWYPFAERLAGEGYRVLTFDFRGYCPGGDGGCSQGTKDINAAPTDLDAAVRYLRAQGPQRIGLAGASMGGTASLLVAGTDPEGIDAVATLSAPQVLSGLGVGLSQLAAVSAPKLFIAGLGDPSGAVQAADAMYADSPQPKDEQIITDDAHGTDLLSGSQGEHVQELIEQWFGRYLAARPTPTAG
jgi:pimeloyl-ACP methyl ester carboxylesterase